MKKSIIFAALMAVVAGQAGAATQAALGSSVYVRADAGIASANVRTSMKSGLQLSDTMAFQTFNGVSYNLLGIRSGVTPHSFAGGGTVGWDCQTGRMIYGAFLSAGVPGYNYTSAVPFSVGDAVPSANAHYKGNFYMNLGVKLGVLVTDNFSVYGGVAYSYLHHTFKWNQPLYQSTSVVQSTGNTMVKKSGNTSGLMLILGGETAVTDNIALGVEGRYAFYPIKINLSKKNVVVGYNVDSGTGVVTPVTDPNLGLKARTDVKQIMATVRYSFNMCR